MIANTVCHVKIFRLVNTRFFQHIICFKIAICSSAVVAGIIVFERSAVLIAHDLWRLACKIAKIAVQQILVNICTKLPFIGNISRIKVFIRPFIKVKAAGDMTRLVSAFSYPRVMSLKCHIKLFFVAVSKILIDKGISHGSTLSCPSHLVNMLIFLIACYAEVILCISCKASKAVLFTFKKVVAEGK